MLAIAPPPAQELCKEAERCLCRKIEEGDTFSLTMVSSFEVNNFFTTNIPGTFPEGVKWSDFNVSDQSNVLPKNKNVLIWARFISCDEYEIIIPIYNAPQTTAV